MGMAFSIDVVYLAGSELPSADALEESAILRRQFRVISRHTVRPNRVGLPRPTSDAVLELPAGRSAELGLTPGAELLIQTVGEGESYGH